ncbi:acyl-CoA oxidase [Ectocarpus siliculosus]|uniref:acyl-CoA oxidase n=1 Tax=Ectocarpus siliculosus TaxID=2880 RepID=D7FYQ4_ECTSI|nr:acyl-CoA oxidase [Ectocarpus siliculosus]|eukprot:CBJ32604.1 acyl-CoA oxidase [Ectocarpus siliculosus]
MKRHGDIIRFHHVRVARTSLLGGVAVVSPEGKYSRVPGGQKQSYGSMLAVRANIVINASRSLARALSIAFRFGAVRTQGYDEREGASPGSERQVLDYPTQQRVLLPLLAHAYALHFAGQHMKSAYHYYLDTQDAEALPDLHATSAGLKSLVTQSVADGIEAARKMCGGHGYSQFSGLPDLSSGYLALATLEGTQQVLEPQTARHLLRSLAAARKGKRLSEAFSYLSPSSTQQGAATTTTSPAVSVRIGAQLRRPETQLRLFRGRARAAVLAAEEAVQRGGKGTAGAGGGAAAGREAMVGAAVELGRATRAHCQLHLVERCMAGVEQQREAAAAAAAAASGEELNTREVNVLSSLRDLFALSIVEEWWPGGLGKTSTHCVLMAQLVLDGKVLGVHPFFVQLRSMTDHSPLKGVAIGDIGPKLGFNSTDNGFCRPAVAACCLPRWWAGGEGGS